MRPQPAALKDVVEGVLAAHAIAAALLLQPLLRPWMNSWGATDAEVQRALPGDAYVPTPASEYTRAITIQAPREEVWRWLAQLGQERGGLYSYTFLQGIIGSRMTNAERIEAEWQPLPLGHRVRLGPEGYPLFRVAQVEQGRSLVLLSADPNTETITMPEGPQDAEYTVSTWQFFLHDAGRDQTRLLVRGRLDYRPRSFLNVLVWKVVTDPISFVMMRKMMLGIKERAERAAGGERRNAPADAMEAQARGG